MHIPVLQKEVIEYLDPKSNENFIDCTFGEGGHSAAILEKNGPTGKVLGIEIDLELYRKLRAAKLKISEGKQVPYGADKNEKLKNRLILTNNNFVNLKKIVEQYKFSSVNGILLDLGISSWHLERSGRGFSFQKDEPLIMRYDWKPSQIFSKNFGGQEAKNFTLPNFWKKFGRASSEKLKTLLTAQEIVNTWSEKEIERILREYGQERFAKKIAKEIVKARKKRTIQTTFQLVEIIKKAVPSWYQHKKILRRKASGFLRGKHFATKTFLALRITVNEELENLKKVLLQALEVLEKGGRLIIISFHSLEDRIVKNFFKERVKENQIKILTKEPITPTQKEISINPRSRSAKLRAFQKI